MFLITGHVNAWSTYFMDACVLYVVEVDPRVQLATSVVASAYGIGFV